MQCVANAVVFQTEDGVIVDCVGEPKPEIKLSCNEEVVFVSVLNICLITRSENISNRLRPINYGGPEGTTLLLENVVSFCKNVTFIFRVKHLSLEFCHRSS